MGVAGDSGAIKRCLGRLGTRKLVCYLALVGTIFAYKTGGTFCRGGFPKGFLPNTQKIPAQEKEAVAETAFTQSMLRSQQVCFVLRHELRQSIA